MRFCKDENAIEKVKEMRKNGKAWREIKAISKEEIGFSFSAIYRYFRKNFPELAKHYSKKQTKIGHINSYGMHSDKFVAVTYRLMKNLDRFDSLVIIGYQNCRSLDKIMKKENKTVVAIDIGTFEDEKINWEFRKFKKENGENAYTYNVTDKSFYTLFKAIVEKYKRCAIFINLTGQLQIIRFVKECKCPLILAVVGPRAGKGKDKKDSSLEGCKAIGAEIDPSYRNGETKSNIAIAVFNL